MRPVMRYHGAKFRLAPWVISFFPGHYAYVEPFGGAGGILMQKPRSKSEVYNDLDDEAVNVFRVLQDKDASRELVRLLTVTPYSRAEFNISYEHISDPVERARRMLIRSHMGFGSAGATKHRTGFRIDSARKYGTAASLWAEYPEHIASFCTRLQGVLIESRPAIAVIENHDREDTLFYMDPPYMHETRSMGSNRGYYQHEMSDQDHEELLNMIQELKGSVIISGYDNPMYDKMLSGWTKRTTQARISAGRGSGIRTECIWMNSRCAENQMQGDLFRKQ